MQAWPDEFEQVLRRYCRFVDPASPIDPDAAWAVLGVGSFDNLTMILDLEESFEVKVPETMLTGEAFGSPATTWSTIEKLLVAQGGTTGE